MAAAAVVTPPTTTGQMGMWNGTKDGETGFIDHAARKSNVNQPKEIDITVQDARYLEPRLTHKKNGFEWLKRPTAMTGNQLAATDEEGKKLIERVYIPEAQKIVEEVTGAQVVIPFDWQTRLQSKKAKDAIASRHEEGGLPVAHVDRDSASAPSRLQWVVGEEEAERLIRTHKRWAGVNVWRPVNQTVGKWPLAMIDHSGVPDWEYDTHMARILSHNDPDAWFKGAKPHDTVLKPDDRYKYWYVSDMTPDECWVFSAFDSDQSRACPHGAFWDDSSKDDAPSRLSFECRFWVFWDEL